MLDLNRGTVIRFHHWDAVKVPKPNRPGIVDETRWGRHSVFYGSTFKQGGVPRDAIIADPRGGTVECDLARCLGRIIDERTYFHGSLLSEVDASAKTTQVFGDGRCPNDVLDQLEEQAEDRLVAFGQAWARTGFLAPSVRVSLLDVLWWRTGLPLREELAFTLLLCDGLKLEEIGRLRRSDLCARRLLPRTQGLLESWKADPDSTLGYVDVDRELEAKWEVLLSHLDRDQRRRCPTWDKIKQRM